MKKILIVLALVAAAQVANAQVKSSAAAKQAIAAAQADTQNEKKAIKVATWIKLGSEYVKAYDAPAGNVWAGASKQELQLVMGNEKPSSVQDVTLQGEHFTKEIYAEKNLYFRDNGQLALIEVTKPVDPEALEKAVEAYRKAHEVDVKGSKTKDISAALESINGKFVQKAYDMYTLGDIASASKYFEKAADAYATAPLSKLDTNSIYNAGFTAWSLKDNARAYKFFKQCYDAGYFAADGEIYAKLADVDTVNTKKYLEEGFVKFPQSQTILIGLINYYLKSGESTDNLFTLLDKAKKNEPNNASLYYVEGNVHSELYTKSDFENTDELASAIAAYDACATVNPEYEFGYIGKGIMYYNMALEYQDKAGKEMDDRKWEILNKEFENALRSCIEPFEQAYNVSKDENIRVNVAEYLKNVYFKFRGEGDNQAKYDKYAKVVSSGVAD